ncbi:MAG: ATP-binding protein [Clostridia bacterium]
MFYYGNNHVLKQLNQSKSATFQILRGPKGLGKSLIAKTLAKHLLCGLKRKSCTCSSCKRFNTSNHPDYFYVGLKDDESNLKVEQIIPLIQETNSQPLMSSYKVVIVDDAHRLTPEAQNKLLKTLENSPGYMRFIFVAHERLLSTIESRAVIHNFFPLLNADMQKFISQLTEDAHKQEMLFAVADGCPGVATRINENAEIYKYFHTITEAVIGNDIKLALSSAGLLKEKDANNIMTVLDSLIEPFLKGLYTLFLDMINVKMGDTFSIRYKSKLSQMAKKVKTVSIGQLYEQLKCIEEAINEAKYNLLTSERLIVLLNNISNNN